MVKRSAVAPEKLKHEGPARVFDCEEDAIAAIKGGKIVAGDVVVIRYEGPKGGPGMREMLNPTSAIAGMELEARRAKWQPREPKVTSGYLARYASLVTSADKGAILQVKQ